MNLSNSERVLKLLKNFIKYPELIPKYFKHNILSKKLPIDLGLPWWSYKAIEYVNTIVENKVIFEYGTGGSTVLFSKKAKSIIAVEDDERWMEKVKNKLKDLKINNVKLVFSRYDFINPINFENSEYLKSVDMNDFDIVIIDGQDWTFQERIKCFKYVEPRMLSGQFIIVDDFWRYPQLKKETSAKKVEIFESVGPGRLGVTSTAVFSY